MQHILGIIPARYASTRFPGKPLADIDGKSMIRRVYEQASLSQHLRRVVVATDDARIASHVRAFGGEVVMTRPDHPSGTDRCREALEQVPGAWDYIINIQGDEPFIAPSQIDLLATLLDGHTELATLMIPVHEPGLLLDPGEVKIVHNRHMEALYFSRQPIPFFKGAAPESWPGHFTYHRHVGMYAYRSDILEAITSLPPSPLELAESLEQLRWLEHGYTIRLAVTDHDSHCIDTPEDIEKVLALQQGRK